VENFDVGCYGVCKKLSKIVVSVPGTFVRVYSDKGENTSERFRDELTQVFDLLSRHPEAVAVAFGRTRLKPMRCFPYIIGNICFEGVVHVTGVQYGGLGWDEFERRQF
jgi:hypothetical protein